MADDDKKFLSKKIRDKIKKALEKKRREKEFLKQFKKDSLMRKLRKKKKKDPFFFSPEIDPKAPKGADFPEMPPPDPKFKNWKAVKKGGIVKKNKGGLMVTPKRAKRGY